ncbi:restriction endonuclease subunit S [Staphylococcus hominis]|uniref:restriction endonuclease subunit S n=1 Tax=Staphylococcus hominis TaxID=1290 RepID=UPI002B25A6DC|nr:restriction endonuclease subunit S [Staphylococcus hominis]
MTNGGYFKPFRIGDLFEIRPSKSYGLTNYTLFKEKGLSPVVVNSSINNGIGGYVNLNTTEKGNSITFSDTTTVDSIFYQPHDFIGYSHVQIMKEKHSGWSKNSSLYFVTLMRKAAQGKFDYGTKFNRENAANLIIKLPILHEKLSFEYMEKYIYIIEENKLKQLEKYLTSTKIISFELTTEEQEALKKYKFILNLPEEQKNNYFKFYNSKDLYGEAIRGKRLKSLDRLKGELPFITAGESLAGVSDYISNDVQVFNKNTITIDMFGSAKYRNFKYGADDHVAVVETSNLSKEAGLFVTAAYNKSANTGVFSFSRNFYAKDADDLNLALPSTQEGEPDYIFMTLIIKAIEKQFLKSISDYIKLKRNI